MARGELEKGVKLYPEQKGMPQISPQHHWKLQCTMFTRKAINKRKNKIMQQKQQKIVSPRDTTKMCFYKTPILIFFFLIVYPHLSWADDSKYISRIGVPSHL